MDESAHDSLGQLARQLSIPLEGLTLDRGTSRAATLTVASGPPSLLILCLEQLLRPEQPTTPVTTAGGGSFWSLIDKGGPCEPEPKALPSLPLPLQLKRSALRRLREAGKLHDEALLQLLDGAFGGLTLRGCRQITADALSLVPLLCPRLMRLDLSWCWQLRAADLDLLPPMPALRALSLRGCFRCDAGACWPLLDRCPALRCANLSGIDALDAPPPPPPPPPAGTALSSKAKGKQLMSLSWVEEAPLAVRAYGAYGSSGRECDARGADGVVGVGVGGGPLCCGGVGGVAGLRALSLQGCSGLGEDALARLPAGCGALRVLCLRGCAGATDAAVAALLPNLAHLAHLDLSGCERLQGDFLLRGRGSASLRTLLLQGCDLLGTVPPPPAANGAFTTVAAAAAAAAAAAGGSVARAARYLGDNAPPSLASTFASLLPQSLLPPSLLPPSHCQHGAVGGNFDVTS